MVIPSSEPKVLHAGTTWQWHIDLGADYPSGTWTLNYYFRSDVQNDELTFAATPDGSGAYDVSVAATTTQNVAPGRYAFAAQVTSGALVHLVRRGLSEVFPDFAQTNTDFRTWAQRALDEIEAVLEGRAAHDQESYTVNDRSVARMSIDELRRYRSWLKDQVAREQGIKPSTIRVAM